MYYPYKNKERNKKNKLYSYIVILLITFLIVFFWGVYYIDNIITPKVMLVADTEMRAKANEIINKNALEIYSDNFRYEDLIRVEKDKEGNISMLKADTVSLNKIATEVALKSQSEIEGLGAIGVKMPLGYVLKNNLLSYMGPKITIKMKPMGMIETSYDSVFESAGINQTRHKIYVNFNCKLKIIIPTQNSELIVKNTIPIAETIIVGKVPRSPLNLDLDLDSNKKNN